MRIRCTVARDGNDSGGAGAAISSCTIRCAPHFGCARRSSTPPPQAPPTRDADTTAAAATDRPDPPTPPRDSAAATHAPTGATPRPRPRPRSPRSVQDRHHRSYRCSMTDNATSANPGLPSPTPRTGEPITASGQACTETPVSSIYQDRTTTGHRSREESSLRLQGRLASLAAGAGCGRPQAAVLAGRSRTPTPRPSRNASPSAPHARAGLPDRPRPQALAGARRLRATPVSSAAWATAAATAGTTARLNTLGMM